MRFDWTDHVRRAQAGDQCSLDTVVIEVRRRLSVYIYRLTLDHHLADDLLQDVLLEIVESLHSLSQSDRFWPWAFKIALNKIRDHHRCGCARSMRGVVPLWAVRTAFPDRGYGVSPADKAADRELLAVISKVVEGLKRPHRYVIACRVYRQMPYAQIAAETGRSEIHVRVLFLRAKRSLQKQLERRGITRWG